MSYDSTDHRVVFAYNGVVIFEKRDPTLLGASSLSTNFLSNIVLGQRDESNTYAEDITRLNIWGKLCQKSSFK